MSDRRQSRFIDFSLLPSWESAHDLWEYLWVVYRVAEPQNDRTKAGDAFVELMRATKKEESWWTFTNEAIAIRREEVYRIVDPHVRRATSNYLIESKPPHKFLRRLATDDTFVPKQVEWNRFETASLSAIFGANPANLIALNKYFSTTSARFEFKGYPLIGWTRAHVWFGVTRFRHLWLQAPEVRAAALEFPFLAVPEFLKLPWSPASPEWRSFRRADEPLSERQRMTMSEALLSLLGEWELLASSRQFRARLLERRPAAPELVWTASSDDEVLVALTAIESYRDTHLVGSAALITPTAGDSVARDVHTVQATSPHPVPYSYLTDELLERYTRHFPWLWQSESGPGALRLRGETLPSQLVMTCFLEAWRSLPPFRPYVKDLRRCWRAIGMADDFDALYKQLIDTRMIKMVRGYGELQIPKFAQHIFPGSPYESLSDQVVDWFLEQRDLQSQKEEWYTAAGTRVEGPTQEAIWQQTIWRLLTWEKSDVIIFSHFEFSSRAAHALHVYIDRYPDDCRALGQLAVYYLEHADLHRGIALLNELKDRKGAEHAYEILHGVAVARWGSIDGKQRAVEILNVGTDECGVFRAGVREIVLGTEELVPQRLAEHFDGRVSALGRALVEELSRH
jgi:hypothetical protein